jgi:nucleotide-binding universal stress UspA family protein
MMKKILVPIDFSPNADDALHFAIQLNEKIEGKITLLHVLDAPMATINTQGEVTANSLEFIYQREIIKGTRERMHQWAELVRKKDQLVNVKMEFGNPFKGIAKELTNEGADWIVMGSKGASGLSEVLVGSNAERVIRHANCPVFVIKGPTSIVGLKTMVFASDLSHEHDSIVARVKEIQQLLGLDVHVVRVRTSHNYRVEALAFEHLLDFEKRTGLNSNSIHTVDAGSADEGIIEFAERVKAGLIVMGTHGRTGLAHLFEGSRAEDVVNHSKIPVLILRISD